ncbi:MAG: DMT family transporter, partial [Actinomycetota bacterium]|nr:DMT family transporter [Actinomycetota bacterium]
WIEEGLASFSPAVITLLRLVFGALTLGVLPPARRGLGREDIPAVALLGLIWMALPFLLFPIAQQWIDSSLAGMINGGVPIFAAVVAALVVRRLPGSKQLVGIGLGFLGVLLVGLPVVQHARSTALGAGLVLLATALYGIAINVAAPLQQKYGALPVLLRAQLFAIAFTLIPGLVAVRGSSWDLSSFAAMVPLGCLGTGLAFYSMTTLVGRVGPSRGAITIYFVPIVAIVLGAVVRDESIAALSLVGTALVLIGAYLTSRHQPGPAPPEPSRASDLVSSG